MLYAEGGWRVRNPEKDELEMAARKERMLDAGFRLFAQRGIAAVSMQEVAAACELGVATLYRYFNTKLALVIAVGTRQWENFAEESRRLDREVNAEQMTAAEQLEHYLNYYIWLYRDYRDLLRFNQSFNSYVLREQASPEQLAPYLRAIDSFEGMFHALYEKGQRDGTIRTDLSEQKMFATTAHIMLAAVARFAQGLVYSAEDEADRTEELLLLKRMMLREFVKDTT